MHGLNFRLDERRDPLNEPVRLIPAARREDVEAEKQVAEIGIFFTRVVDVFGYVVVHAVASERHQQHSLEWVRTEFHIGQSSFAEVAAKEFLRPQRLDVSDELKQIVKLLRILRHK